MLKPYSRRLLILLIEDDPGTATLIRAVLESEGHSLTVAQNGRSGLRKAGVGDDDSNIPICSNWDLLIVDRMLPDMDGIRVVQTLRHANIATPALFLTALSSVDDRVSGLRAGGDDYLLKPFAAPELAARVLSVARRCTPKPIERVLRVRDLELDRLTRTVTRAGRRIGLRPREYDVLEYLMRHVDHIVTRKMLLEDVWGFHFDPQTRVVESHISRLRAKLDHGSSCELLQTIRGQGYLLEDSG